MSDIIHCPACMNVLHSDDSVERGEQHTRVSCRTCGQFKFTGTAAAVLKNPEIDTIARASLIHRLRSASLNKNFVLNSTIVEDWRNSAALPSPAEQIENLALWLAGSSRTAGQKFDIEFQSFQAIIGVADQAGFLWVLRHAFEAGLINREPTTLLDGTSRVVSTSLTLRGWQLTEEIQKAGRKSRHAFIAMQFGEPDLETFVRNQLVPAVRSTGFELRALNDGQGAGLIDDQLRVAIRRARFVLVELTHGNQGAYWEGGFAEGLGKPVIYLCRSDVFNDAKHPNRPHFDTNHLVTIIWDPSDLAGAATRLAACIRSTLPEEAKMDDEVSA